MKKNEIISVDNNIISKEERDAYAILRGRDQNKRIWYMEARFRGIYIPSTRDRASVKIVRLGFGYEHRVGLLNRYTFGLVGKRKMRERYRAIVRDVDVATSQDAGPFITKDYRKKVRNLLEEKGIAEHFPDPRLDQLLETLEIRVLGLLYSR